MWQWNEKVDELFFLSFLLHRELFSSVTLLCSSAYGTTKTELLFWRIIYTFKSALQIVPPKANSDTKYFSI